MGPKNWIVGKLTTWLTKDRDFTGTPLCDFERISYEIKPCDVLLIEGRSRVSDVIKNITQSPWTHSALYIGRIHEIDDPALRKRVEDNYGGDPSDQLILEALLGEGTIINNLSKYNDDHVRICRPHGISRNDAKKVCAYAINYIGCGYDVRQLLDLARFMFPYAFLPRRWRSSLFQHNAGLQTRTVCSSLIASAYSSVHFPIMPVIHRTEDGHMKLFKRNERLYTPRDFDYSPYFDIIKYPYLGFEDLAIYRKLPWDKHGRICNDDEDCFLPEEPSNISFEEKEITEVKKQQSSTKESPNTKKTLHQSQAAYYPVSNLAIDLLNQEINKKEEE